MNLYEFTVRGKKWNDNDERYLIESDNPFNALTKLRILHGEDVYRRSYMCYDCNKQKLVKELYSYTMLREQLKRDWGKRFQRRTGKAR